MAKNLKSKMLDAFAWTTIDRFGQQIVQFVIGVILARILSPDDYGLIGMVAIFIAVSTVLVDGGFGQAIIKKQNASEKDFNTVFYFNIIASIVLYTILFFISPVISKFYNQPQLTSILRVLSLTALFYSIYFIQYVLLNKRMQFQSLALINIITVIVSGIVGIIMAYKGYGVWALVGQQISNQLIRSILFPVIVKWKPALLFSISVIKEFWSFSIPLLGTTLLNVLFNNIYVILLGKFYPKKKVGYYFQASKYSDTVNLTIQQILFSSTYPLLVQIQDDNERLIRIQSRLVKTISLIFFPLIAVLIVIAKPLFIVLITSKWIESIVLFQLLLIANLFTPIYSLNTSLLNAKGLTKQTFNLELVKKLLIVISIVICFSYGIKIMLLGYIIANFIAYFISSYYIRKHLNYKIREQLLNILPPLFIGIITGMFASIFGFLKMGNITLLIVQLTAALLFYSAVFRLTYPQLSVNIFKFIQIKIFSFIENMKPNP
ncbi:MAG: lipopolysaccharide biosynthesis protein [Paludibacteraceae bacterium]